MDANLDIILAAGDDLQIEKIEVGEKVYLDGNTSGIAKDPWDTIRCNKVFLRATVTSPQSGGYKSLTVTTCKSLGLYAGFEHQQTDEVMQCQD
jgi:isocitrate dehydrogenase